MAGSGSGLYVNGVLSHPSWSSRPSKRARTQRSIWNSADDWDELVAISQLSTASVSTRRPRPRGLQTLSRCAADTAARHFKRLYEDGRGLGMGVGAEGEQGRRGWWEEEWAWVPDHLKLRVREGVFKRWGGYLTLQIIKDLEEGSWFSGTFAVERKLFIFPPELDLPGHLLPALSKSTTLAFIQPTHPDLERITHLRLQHCSTTTDKAIAGLISLLPNLVSINLKGCSLAGEVACRSILDCSRLKSLNLKGTNLAEGDMRPILHRRRSDMEVLKVDSIVFTKADNIIPTSLPNMTSLCLPGNILQPPSKGLQTLAKKFNHTIAHPTPRPPDPSAQFDWSRLDIICPSLQKLALPSLLIHPTAHITLRPHSLVKLSLGPAGPPVPVTILSELIASQCRSLRTLHLGHIYSPDARAEVPFETLGAALEACSHMQDFRWVCDPAGSKNQAADVAMKRFADRVYVNALRGSWRASLTRLHLAIPQRLPSEAFVPHPHIPPSTPCPPLEQLDLPGADLSSPAEFAMALTSFRRLRSLDVSATGLTTDHVFVILDSCALLSRIDLTSCRGVNVRMRRNMFDAWKEDREKRKNEMEGEGGDEELNPGRRSKRSRR